MSDDNKPGSPADDAKPKDEQSQAETQEDAEDLWAAAMAEQGVEPEPEPEPEPQPAPKPAPRPEPKPAKQSKDSNDASFVSAADERTMFQSFDEGGPSHPTRDLNIIMDIPVKLSVELGRTRITIKQLLELAQGSVVELDGLAGEPMDILINGYLIAQGEVVVVEDKYGIRITEIITPSERVQKLNR
ncbi:flagellar motor switch protein FliN [Salinicola sp. DM10]|uniref:flagellar motor switch protein FliN n=1 Tax=Salinicola sp. DM10 TaxID=2815721 RepID=UPI001A8DFBE6|nr:flagellar motor switch protein FliN [Salinicola sp. DM10]MCE3025813.1 flagellar motor switch protein FliN [Salinicola sp. DM10]